MAPVGYLSLDAGGHVLAANEAVSGQLGVPGGELLGRRLLLFVHESSRAEFADFLATLQRGTTGRLEVRLLRQGGPPLIAQLDCINNGAGELRISVTDITALAEARQAIAALNETLEARVQARTAQVQALNEELESFVRSTRQALDTPLRHIGSFAALLEMPQAEKSAERKRHYLQEVIAAAQQVQTLTGALTEYFRLGRQPAHTAPVDLERVVTEVRKELRAHFGERNITWTQGQLPTVIGNSHTLQLLFWHLLGNALKFSRPKPETRIEISAQETEREYIIGVNDNGVGFNMEQQARLFTLFQHLHSARQFSDLGLGLGLASVQRIALRHGGRVWAEGKEGEGACFWVALPKDPALHL